MAHEIEEKEVCPELYEEPKVCAKGWADAASYTYPWHTLRHDGGGVPEYATYAAHDVAWPEPERAPRQVYIERLVGGPCAGEGANADFRVPMIRATQQVHVPPHYMGGPDTLAHVQQHLYRRFSFNCDGTEFIGYAYDRMAGNNIAVLTEIMHGYHARR